MVCELYLSKIVRKKGSTWQGRESQEYSVLQKHKQLGRTVTEWEWISLRR